MVINMVYVMENPVENGMIWKMAGLSSGNSHLEMDENWGEPYFRKPT